MVTDSVGLMSYKISLLINRGPPALNDLLALYLKHS